MHIHLLLFAFNLKFDGAIHRPAFDPQFFHIASPMAKCALLDLRSIYWVYRVFRSLSPVIYSHISINIKFVGVLD